MNNDLSESKHKVIQYLAVTAQVFIVLFWFVSIPLVEHYPKKMALTVSSFVVFFYFFYVFFLAKRNKGKLVYQKRWIWFLFFSLVMALFCYFFEFFLSVFVFLVMAFCNPVSLRVLIVWPMVSFFSGS